MLGEYLSSSELSEDEYIPKNPLHRTKMSPDILDEIQIDPQGKTSLSK